EGAVSQRREINRAGAFACVVALGREAVEVQATNANTTGTATIRPMPRIRMAGFSASPQMVTQLEHATSVNASLRPRTLRGKPAPAAFCGRAAHGSGVGSTPGEYGRSPCPRYSDCGWLIAMGSPRWVAARMWALADLRGRWRSWVVLGLLGGATMGLAAAGLAGARRTADAVPRMERVTHFADAAVLANSPSFDAGQRSAMASLPEVRASYPFMIAIGLSVIRPSRLQSSSLLPTTPQSVGQLVGVLVAGRMPDPTRPDEVVVDENARRLFGLGLGSTVVVAQSIPAGEVAQLPSGIVPRHVNLEIRVPLHVVGISKSVSSDPGWVPSSGFYRLYGPRLAGFVNAFVSLHGGERDLSRLETDVSRIAGQPVNVESTQDLFGLRKAKDVTGIERDGLVLFALAVILGGGVLVGQALVRAVTAGAADLPTWRAIGANRATVVPALVLPTTVTATVGALMTVIIAIVLSSRFPIGLARTYDLDPGTHADWLVLALAATVLAVAALVAATLAAWWRTAHTERADVRASTSGRFAAGAGMPPALEIGFRLAAEPGRGRTAVPVRSALVGAIVGVLGVVACFTFRAGLDNAVASPQRSGVVWDYIVASGDGTVAPADMTAIAHDANVAATLDAEWARALPVNGVPTPTFGTRSLKGNLELVVLAGRAPRTQNEIAFAPTSMHALHLHVGDQATIGQARRHVRVVGEALLPATSHTDYDQSGWMTQDGLHAALPPPDQLGHDDIQDQVLVRWQPNIHVGAAQAKLSDLGGGHNYNTAPATRPTAVVDLGRLRTLPLTLGIFFSLLAAATVAHALVTTVRRRQHDLAVLRSLGFTRRQSRVAIGWQATLITIVGLIIGIPLGIAFGRIAWRTLADHFPLVYAPPFALVTVILVIPVALAIANLLAAGPAHVATRISP
ncbi:MAG TPA: FtsX-like permease family protein, partial [Acidimicrobiia bacterium]|nr:FtsX-like permease family protein [Acidimicrobiia bacterium]